MIEKKEDTMTKAVQMTPRLMRVLTSQEGERLTPAQQQRRLAQRRNAALRRKQYVQIKGQTILPLN